LYSTFAIKLWLKKTIEQNSDRKPEQFAPNLAFRAFSRCPAYMYQITDFSESSASGYLLRRPFDAGGNNVRA
jgi:hypothetical protein